MTGNLGASSRYEGAITTQLKEFMSNANPVVLFSAAVANKDVNCLNAISRVLDRHWYVLGEEVTAFEREFASYINVSHCVAVANGTDALELALRTVGVAAGDKVVAVANAGFYGSTAIHAVGAVPVYIDVEESTLTMSAAALVQALELKPKAVIVTHLYGQLANIEELTELATRAGVQVIEDCAQAHGARRNGRLAGSWGDVSCFSFYPTKNLGALGDGGAVVTNSDKLAARLRTLRQYGWSAKYKVAVSGGCNSRLDEMQAAILREKLPLLDKWNDERRCIAEKYNHAFSSLPFISIPSVGEDYVGHLYVVRVNQREEFREALHHAGIATDIHYPIPDHLQPAYPGAKLVNSLAVTDAASKTTVTLPCYPGLTDVESDRVIDAVNAFFH